MRVGPALADATARLREAGSPTPRLDAELLLGHATGRDRAWLIAHPEAEVSAAGWSQLVERRAGGEPIAYIRGYKEWRSLRIRTDRRALIPRPETELLADAAIGEVAARLVADGRPIVLWEVATGSGAVATALALGFREAIALGRVRLIASDISPDALGLASENLAAHDVRGAVELVEADLLEPAGRDLPLPDVVVSNLPYVSSAEVDLRHGSLGHEPRVALDGGPDGLVLLRRLLGSMARTTAGGAVAFLEIGVGQVSVIRELAPSGASVSVVPDLAGLDRVVRVGMPH